MTQKFYMLLVNKILGINNKKVVFMSFGGRSFSDNPRAISEMLHKMYPDFEIVWMFINPNEKIKIVPNYIRCVQTGSLKALRELATAKFWVDNFNKPITTYKSKNQVYIQTWHGDRGFKKVLYDSTFISSNDRYIESEICDLALSGSLYADKVYKSAFQYNGEIMKFGCPRNDILVENSSEKALNIKKILKIPANIKVLLFAPTLRREASVKKAYQPTCKIDLPKTIKALEEKTGSEWVCFVRAHSAVKGLSGIPKDFSKIIDVTSYEEMSELLLITDLLITDYSSSAPDFALLNRAIILFQDDREEYLRYDRTFYFDIDSSPYIVVQNQEELSKTIEKLDFNKVPQNCRDILDFYETVETGEASKKVVEYMISKS